jgi:hypothetical protein
VNGMSRETDLQRIAVHADTFGPRGIGLNMHREDAAAFVVSHTGMERTHKNEGVKRWL